MGMLLFVTLCLTYVGYLGCHKAGTYKGFYGQAFVWCGLTSVLLIVALVYRWAR